MNFKQAFLLAIATSAVLMPACTASAPAPNTNATNQAATVNANQTQLANAVASPAATVAPPTTAAAGSPSAIAAQYYQAMVKKDEMAFRQTLSQPTLREFAGEARKENAKSLVDYWTGFSSPAKRLQMRNEQIQGDAAYVELANDAGVYTKHKLVRENNQWKLDLTEATTSKLSN